MASEQNVENKNILITGGASGLGAAFAEGFLKSGAKNIAILDIAVELGKKVAETLNKTYKDKVIFIKCDVSKEEEIMNAFQQALDALKRIDVVVNNAGIMNDSMHMWRTSVAVNLQGVISFTEKGIRHMRKDENGAGGTIVNISSLAALGTKGFFPVYTCTKTAVLHFSRSLSTPEFYNDTGIRIMTICPGSTDTAIITNLDSKLFEYSKPKEWLEFVLSNEQSVDSVVQAILKMLREGTPGSVWLAKFNEPVEDITSILDKSDESFEKYFAPENM